MEAKRAIRELQRLRDEARLVQVRRPGPDHRSWRAKTFAVLTRSLGEDAGVVREFGELRYHVGIWTGAPGEAEADARYFAARIDDAGALIEAAIYELGLLVDEPAVGSVPNMESDAEGRGGDLRHFIDDDGGYLAWLSAHPAGFVISANLNSRPVGLMLHRAGCRTISAPSAGLTVTADDTKVCGTRAQLERFARQLGGVVQHCKICLYEQEAPAVRVTGKYAPLRDYLERAAGDELMMTFTQIEALVGVLPKSARMHRAWWSNSSSTSRAWRDAGWRLRSVDQVRGQAIFRRDSNPFPSITAVDGAAARPDGQIMTAVGAASKATRTIPGRNQVTGHAFISYVREDTQKVDRLQRILQDSGIPVWRDAANLWPGEDWQWEIRNAITSNALAFIACFSSNSIARGTNYQNAELMLAIDQLRLRRPERPWLIPVRFDDCQIPDRDIGGGRSLTSIQRADLFGDLHDHATARLAEVILRILSSAAPNPW